MSNFDELVPRVPGLKVVQLEHLANAVRNELGLVAPDKVDWLHVAEFALPAHGVDVFPVSESELLVHGAEAVTVVNPGTERVTVLLSADDYDALEEPYGGRARATLNHELGHAVLHREVLKRMQVPATSPGGLARHPRSEVPAFVDPEWQAWVFAGALLMPRSSLAAMRGAAPWETARIHQVTESFLQTRLDLIDRHGGLR